jgi:hypothetical protein
VNAGVDNRCQLIGFRKLALSFQRFYQLKLVLIIVVLVKNTLKAALTRRPGLLLRVSDQSRILPL